MNRYPTRILVLIIIISLLFTNALAASNNRKNISSLDTGVTATVNYGDWLEGTQSTFDISLSNVPADAGLSNGIYTGWCIQPWITGELHNKPAKLYTSLSNALPSDLAELPWNEINYVLNHKIRGEEKSDLEFYKDVQTAIVLLLGVTNPEFGISPEAQLMFDNAIVHSEYVPGNGDIVAVIIYSDGMSEKKSDRIQETIIEVRLIPKPTNTPTFTPTGTLPTNTSTNTPTFTRTGTLPTYTPTNRPTFTPTGTLPTNTPTNTATFTPTGTLPTNTPTNTATFTPTGTLPTNTPTNTATFTPTGTLPTNTPTNTATFTPTGTLSTNTPTFTPTGTLPTTCQPIQVIADFSRVAVGSSIEGMGVVAPNLNIDAKGTAVRIAEGVEPLAFGAPNGINFTINGGLNPNGGFSDLSTKSAQQAHQYTFTFAAGTVINKFSLHMLDFGDLNPSNDPYHYASITAFDANNNIASRSEMSFLSDVNYNSPQYGYLGITSDAKTALPGQPGNWMWNVYGSGITKVVLDFGAGYDPNIAFDTLSYTTECQACVVPTTISDFSSIPNGASVEGMGVVAPGLNIDAKGTAVKIAEGVEPLAFGAPNGINFTINGGLNPNGGFSDLITKSAQQAHQYTFTFAPGIVIYKFSLHMLDFGDLNPSNSTQHYASITAFDANNNIVSKSEMSFLSDLNYNSPQYGYLGITSDAKTALPGQPGNWMWNVYGSGITKVVLDFGAGYDPNIAFDTLGYCLSSP